MSKLINKIARNIVSNFPDIIAHVKLSDGWNLERTQNIELDANPRQATVVFGDYVSLNCEVAESQEAQAVGLQKYAELPKEHGMLFPYMDSPKQVSFHMGSVAFPIDIIYVGSDNRVTKIMAEVEPGSPGAWSHPHVAAMVEANGGFCKEHDITVGTPVGIGFGQKWARQAQTQGGIAVAFGRSPSGVCEIHRDPFGFAIYVNSVVWDVAKDLNEAKQRAELALGQIDWQANKDDPLSPPKRWSEQQIMDLLRSMKNKYKQNEEDAMITLTEAGAAGTINVPEDEKRYWRSLYKMAQEHFDPEQNRADWYTRRPVMSPEMGHDRFRDRDLVDQQVVNQPMSSHHEEWWGYDPITVGDEGSDFPLDPDGDSDGNIMITRPG